MLMTSCPPSSISIDLPGAEFHGRRSAEVMAGASASTAQCYRCSNDNNLRRTDLLRRPGAVQRAVGMNNRHKYGQTSHYVLATVADDERVGRIDHPSRDTLHIFT